MPTGLFRKYLFQVLFQGTALDVGSIDGLLPSRQTGTSHESRDKIDKMALKPLRHSSWTRGGPRRIHGIGMNVRRLALCAFCSIVCPRFRLLHTDSRWCLWWWVFAGLFANIRLTRNTSYDKALFSLWCYFFCSCFFVSLHGDWSRLSVQYSYNGLAFSPYSQCSMFPPIIN